MTWEERQDRLIDDDRDADRRERFATPSDSAIQYDRVRRRERAEAMLRDAGKCSRAEAQKILEYCFVWRCDEADTLAAAWQGE
jgi:hypothetical protein